MQNAGLKSQVGIKIAERNTPNLRYSDNTTLMLEIGEVVKSLLMRVKDESEKAGLKFNIKKTKIMASSPIISWQTKGEKVETVINFIFLNSRSTVDGDFSHENKRCLLFGRKAMANLDSMLQNKDITLLTESI